eukprot:CAMPEP_0194273726 /NCGR_PEP_ID=MMETSP0169-20130528/7006_1 /TAXON_ID=218684 /ORGANISM="Corethron pennatum, Strain L29A3" /LENGTH=277 /DNA_ID=CAMNT_0039016765 /DNA_START=126 /DNA_END=956 /DNA_ORIENTATION=-
MFLRFIAFAYLTRTCVSGARPWALADRVTTATSKGNPPVPYAGAQQLDYSEYLKQARTGDVLLFYGTDDIEKVIRIFTNGPFYHAALVFRGALPDEDASEYGDRVRVLQATSTAQEVDFEGHHGDENGEVMLVDIETLIKFEITDGENVQVTVRRLVAAEPQLERIKAKILRTARDTLLKPFTIGSGDHADGAYIADTILPPFLQLDRRTFRTYVCSTLVAHALIAAGVLDPEKHPLGSDIHFFPKHFDEEFLPVESTQDFCEGVCLGKETRLTGTA